MNKVEIAPGSEDNKTAASIYNLIINSNKTELDMPMSTFKKIIIECLKGFEDNSYIIFNEGHEPDDNMDIKLRPKFEIGSKYHRVHAQILTTIIHNSNIKINIDAIKARLPPGFNVWAPLQLMASRNLTRVLRYNNKQNL